MSGSCKNKLEKEIAEMFDILQFSGSDALGLGQYLYRYDTETWQKVAQSWKVRITLKVCAG